MSLGSLEHGPDDQSFTLCNGQIFEAMNRQVYITVAQRGLNLGREKPLASDFGQRAAQFTVAARRVNFDLGPQTWPRSSQCGRHKVGLPASQLTGTRAQDQRAAIEVYVRYRTGLQNYFVGH